MLIVFIIGIVSSIMIVLRISVVVIIVLNFFYGLVGLCDWLVIVDYD